MWTHTRLAWLPGRRTILLVLALTIASTGAWDADAGQFQNGFRYANPNVLSGKLSVSFSGQFQGDGGPICLIPTAEMRIFGGDVSMPITPPRGFVVSDVVLFWTRLRALRDERGNFVFDENGRLQFADAPTQIMNIDDPPGANVGRIELRSSPEQRIFNYLYVGPGITIGPVTTTVPIVTDGTMNGKVPNVFVARRDAKTGFPVVNEGAGHCLVPTEERANDPHTGEIYPKLLFRGETVVEGVIELLPDHKPSGATKY